MVSILPIDLSGFGKNPFGKNIWRVVWGPSRTYKAGMKSETGTVQVKELPLYPGTQAWILERWLPPVKFAGTREAWEIQERNNDVQLGPYPAEGEWCGCDDLWQQIPSVSDVVAKVNLILYGVNFTFDEKRNAIMENERRKEESWLSRGMDIWKDSQGAFNNKPTNINPAKKTADKVRLDVAAEDLGKPVGDGKFFQS